MKISLVSVSAAAPALRGSPSRSAISPITSPSSRRFIGRLATVLGGQIDADDAGDDQIEPVGLVALVEESGVGLKRRLAGDAGKPAEVARRQGR